MASGILLKNIEVLLHCYKLKLLQEDLSSYSTHHKTNPNAQRYLFSFLKSYVTNKNENKDVQKLKFLSLKRLQKSAPSDPFMLDLNLMYFDKATRKSSQKKKRKKFLKSFSVLMNLLDHPSMLNHAPTWYKLYEQMQSAKNILSELCFDKLVKSLWINSGRKTWWPIFHFTRAQAEKIAINADQELVKAKLYVASIFVGPDCHFCSTVRQSVIS